MENLGVRDAKKARAIWLDRWQKELCREVLTRSLFIYKQWYWNGAQYGDADFPIKPDWWRVRASRMIDIDSLVGELVDRMEAAGYEVVMQNENSKLYFMIKW